MQRKPITQMFPWLIPVRRRQRILCFYAAMKLDGNRYAQARLARPLPDEVFCAKSVLINPNTGQDIRYQYNKVFNLKLACEHMNGLLVRPGETFSFWRAVRGADRITPYKNALVTVNGKTTASYGGGLCQLSTLIYWLLLNSRLTITERHPHAAKDFPPPPGDLPPAADATVSEGWKDLKAYNGTQTVFQLMFGFDDTHITGRLLAGEAAHE